MENHVFSFIFIGDTHGFIDDFKKQKEIIESIDPEFVLSEQMQNISLFSEKDYDEMKIPHEMKKLVEFCKNKKIKLAGIDLKNFGFNKKLDEIIKGKRAPTIEENKMLNEIIKKRQSHHIKKLKEFEGKSKKPIVVILGAWHLRRESPIMKKIGNYKSIFPSDKNGNLLMKPSKKEEVSYSEKVKYDE